MSKPMLVTLPFVLLLLDYWPLGRMSCERLDGQAQVSSRSLVVLHRSRKAPVLRALRQPRAW